MAGEEDVCISNQSYAIVLYIKAVDIHWRSMSMNPHYFRRDAIRQPEQSTFDYREYDRSGVIFNERHYTHILDLLRGRCQIFDSEYYNFAIAPVDKYSISRLHGVIHKTNDFLCKVYSGYHQKDDMRPEFIHHIMKYMRFELYTLEQKLTQVTNDLQMTEVLLLRRTFYRNHMGKLQTELAKRARHQLAGKTIKTWKKSDDFFLEPDPVQSAEDLNWLHEQTMQYQPQHD